MIEKIIMEINGKKSQILIGIDILDSVGKLISEIMEINKIAIITNPTVNALYGARVMNSLEKSGFECTIMEIPDSETSKSMEWASECYNFLSRNGFDRKSCIIGLGGGVVGDLAGFVAATYLRGIELVQIPTTLLGQVDSAIGGKTGLNLPEGKNLVGAFHQPSIVISDINTLKTLPEMDYVSGLAEIVKYGIITDAELFSWLESDFDEILLRDENALVKVVARCSGIKANIVEQDERDENERMVLNYGHTLGHALESASEYEYSHGEAVAIGMTFAARISLKIGMLSENDFNRISVLIQTMSLPDSPEKFSGGGLIGFMKTDKKTMGGKLTLVLPTRIGEAIILSDFDNDLILETLEEMRP